jgi:2-polyprenyl-3-methyl-5-hydroxy-6-metoxy-1,4-benzoquinol methylase
MLPSASPKATPTCWICGSSDLRLAKKGNLDSALASSDFAITDSRYGLTTDIFRCQACGFLECCNQQDVLGFYEQLEDHSYEEGWEQRSEQQKKLLSVLPAATPGKRLLDIGAGAGMLVDQAGQLGYAAEGVEPSEWLAGRARQRGLRVHRGTFPHPKTGGPYDVVTLVDVIEHVPNPVQLLASIRGILAPGGVALVVTPDAGSLAAKMLGWRWWHYRLAHIGYFSKSTLNAALQKAGLEVTRWGRPAWYFRGDYLFERALSYSPVRIRPAAWMTRVTVPLNLGDSLYAICKAAKR